MPASPRATVIGIGAAVLIAALVFVVPAMVLTAYVGSVSERDSIREQTTHAIRSLQRYGVEPGGISPPKPVPLEGHPMRLVPVVGELTAFETTSTPLSRQPGSLLVYIGTTDPERQTVSAAEFAPDIITSEAADEVGEIVAADATLGVPIAFADGTVWLLRSTTPSRELAPFLRRDTMAVNDRDERLEPFRLRKR